MTVDLKAWEEFFSENVRKDKALIAGYLEYLRLADEKSVPPIFENEHLRLLLGLAGFEFAALMAEASPRYRLFQIPKRNGGVRQISSPIPALYHVQKWILDNILSPFKMPECAHGGIKGRSIVTNAECHVGQKSLLKLDLTDFYGSIGLAKGISIFRSAHYPYNVALSLSRFCFEKNKLPQGAATSASIANLTCSVMDARLTSLAKKYDLAYTRYLDDLTFSGSFINERLIEIVSEIAIQSGLSLNPAKTRLIRGKSAKYVTGISVGGDRMRLARSLRRSFRNEAVQLLGRGIRAHNRFHGVADPLVIERTLGKFAFWRQIEPDSKVATSLFERLLEMRRETDNPEQLPESRLPKSFIDLDPTPDSP